MSHFIVRTNIVICNFKGINRCVASNVFLSQCYHWYGCQAWSLESKHIGTFDVTWRKAVRKVWYIPNIFRSKLLPELVDVSTVCFKAMKLFSTMYNIIMIMCKSQNSKINLLCKIKVHSYKKDINQSNPVLFLYWSGYAGPHGKPRSFGRSRSHKVR